MKVASRASATRERSLRLSKAERGNLYFFNKGGFESLSHRGAQPEALEGEANETMIIMSKGYMYILECADGSFYTGSTKDLDLRIKQHQAGEGANYTRKRLPVKLIYYEEFSRIDNAFYREKQVQGWSRKKKQALIDGNSSDLPGLSIAYRDKDVND